MKEKSHARQKDIEKKRREQVARKQAEAEARQQLIREEKEQQVRLKREEDHIQKEMAKIRRAMEEEKKATKEKLDRCVGIKMLYCMSLDLLMFLHCTSHVNIASIKCKRCRGSRSI